MSGTTTGPQAAEGWAMARAPRSSSLVLEVCGHATPVSVDEARLLSARLRRSLVADDCRELRAAIGRELRHVRAGRTPEPVHVSPSEAGALTRALLPQPLGGAPLPSGLRELRATAVRAAAGHG